MPVVEALRTSLAGNRISSLMGILNGTSNYILSEMTSNGLDFDVALKQAQQLGYAEADPTLDIDGHDAAHKLTLLIRLAYGVNYPYTAMPVRGIRGMSSLDIALAREFGYRIKLIAQVRERRDPGQDDGKVRLEAGVFPDVYKRQPEEFRKMGSVEFSKLLLTEAQVAVSPGLGFGAYGDEYVRFALIENDHRTRQAVRNIRRLLSGSCLLYTSCMTPCARRRPGRPCAGCSSAFLRRRWIWATASGCGTACAPHGRTA